MRQSGYINFFNVNKCGIYRNFSANPKGLELSDIFHKLKDWKDSRNFEATNPWDSTTHRNKTACYCHEIHHDATTDDFLLVLWKSESDKNGPLYGISVNEDGTTGKAIEQTKAKGKRNMIWGRPCYYWVIPEFNIVASLKFDNSRTDSVMFQDWIRGCVNFRLPLPEYKNKTTEKGFTRFDIINDKEDKYSYSFQFDVSMKSLSTSSAEIKELAKRITHIIRRETVSIKMVDKRRGFAKYFARFEVPYASAENNSSRRVELRIEAKPTSDEIKQIIESHAEDNDNGSWEDVGFLVDKSTKIIWASKYRLTANISVEDYDEPVISASHLYTIISGSRDTYLSPVKKDLKLQQEATEKKDTELQKKAAND